MIPQMRTSFSYPHENSIEDENTFVRKKQLSPAPGKLFLYEVSLNFCVEAPRSFRPGEHFSPQPTPQRDALARKAQGLSCGNRICHRSLPPDLFPQPASHSAPAANELSCSTLGADGSSLLLHQMTTESVNIITALT